MKPSERLKEIEKYMSGDLLMEPKEARENEIWLISRVKRLTEALEKIASVKYGLELTDSDEYLLEHWSKQALEYEAIARKAMDAE